jgi:hypothetical protein
LIDPLVRKLREIKFDERHCGARLGFYEGLPDFERPRGPEPFLSSTSDALDIVLALFLLNEEVPFDQALEVFTEADLYALRTMSLIQIQEDRIFSPLNLLPCSGHYIVTDRRVFAKNHPPEFSRIMWLYPESYMLAGLVDRTTRIQRALDLGTGSGVHALKACQHSAEVIGVDINPRAIAFSKFNQRLNNLHNVEFRLGDLYAPVGDMKFDLIVSNPPFNPIPTVQAGTDYWSGGASGEEILGRIIAGLDAHLTEDGICHIITLLCHQKSGPTYGEKLDRWLTGGLKRFDVMAHVGDQSKYFSRQDENYFFNADFAERERFLRAEFSRFEFGVISIRRCKEGDGHYYHGPSRTPLPLFDQDARIRNPITQRTFGESRNELQPVP